MIILSKIFFFLFITSTICSQSVYSLLTKVEDDKTVYYKLDNLPDELNLGHNGEGNIWNFTTLKAPVVHEFKYKSRSKGKYSHLFSDATILLQDPWGLEKYYKKEKGNYYLISEVLPPKSKRSQPIIKKYSKALPVKDISNKNKSNKYSSGIWTINLEKYELEEWGISSKNPLRITGNEDIIESSDASGILYLPDIIGNVTRILLRLINDIKVEELIEGLWIEKDKSIIKPLKHLFPNYSEYYLFIDDESEDVLLSISLNELGKPINVLFKSREIENVRLYNSLGSNQFVLHPSTTFGDVRLDFISFASGNYTLEIYNIIGKKLWSQLYTINGDKTLKEDFSFLPKGTYQYSLLDEGRNRLVSRRLAIIKP